MDTYLTYLYIFSLIVGGVLLGASILFGGKDLEADGAEVDLDAGAEAGLDLDAEVHGPEAYLDDVAALGGGRRWYTALFSVRFWTFFLTFFAATGLSLQGFGLVDGPWLGLLFAVAMGSATGAMAAKVTRWLMRKDATSSVGSDDYIGKSVRVMLPVEPGGTGKVRLQLKGHTVDVLATTDEEQPIGPEDEAIIVEMEGHVARVARLGRRDSAP